MPNFAQTVSSKATAYIEETLISSLAKGGFVAASPDGGGRLGQAKFRSVYSVTDGIADATTTLQLEFWQRAFEYRLFERCPISSKLAFCAANVRSPPDWRHWQMFHAQKQGLQFPATYSVQFSKVKTHSQ